MYQERERNANLGNTFSFKTYLNGLRYLYGQLDVGQGIVSCELG